MVALRFLQQHLRVVWRSGRERADRQTDRQSGANRMKSIKIQRNKLKLIMVLKGMNGRIKKSCTRHPRNDGKRGEMKNLM